MRTISNYKIEKETYEAQHEAGRHNPAQVLKFRDKSGKHEVTLESGHFDHISVFREGLETVVLSMHVGFGYIGIQVIFEGEEIASRFLQGWEVEQELGEGWENKTDNYLARTMYHDAMEAL